MSSFRHEYYLEHREEILKKGRERYRRDWADPVKRAKFLEAHRVKQRKYTIPERGPLTEYEKGFLEALIDGEGCISWSRHHSKTAKPGHGWAFVLLISNKNIEILRKAQAIITRGSIRGPDKKGCYSYSSGANTLRWLLPQLNLIVKRKQQACVQEALAIINYNGGRHDERYWERLNEILAMKKRAKGVRRT